MNSPSPLRLSGDRDLLAGRCLLVVEDDYLNAQALACLLEGAGAEVVALLGWLDEAIDFVERNGDRFDGAVLDLNLHGERSYPLADRLVAQAVPFVLVTGYDDDMIDDRYAGHPRCQKPYDASALIRTIAGAHA